MKKYFFVLVVCFMFFCLSLNGQGRVTIEITSSPEIAINAVILINEKKTSFYEEFCNYVAKDLNASDVIEIRDKIFKEKIETNQEMDSVLLKNDAKIFILFKFNDKLETKVYDTLEKSLLFEFEKGIEKSPVLLAHAVSDEIIFRLTGKPGISRSKILYITKNNGTHNLMMCDYDGSNSVVLLSAKYIINYPRWFPGMKNIVFLSYRNFFPSLDLLNLETGEIRTFIAEPGLNACVSFFRNQDMGAVVLSRSGNPDIYIVDLKGNILRRLTEKQSLNASPSVSPDGQKIAFVSDRDGKTRLWVMNSYGMNARKIDIPSNYITSPVWSPDGKYLAYAVRYGTDMFIEIYHWETGKRKILTTGLSWCDAPSWAPDSRHLLFTCQEKYKNSLWTVDIYSLKKRKIVDNAWSGCWDIR